MKRNGLMILALLLATAHLALVVLGASHVSFSFAGLFPERMLALYSRASGADNGFGFFSPGVGAQLRARFEIVDTEGNSREVPLAESPSREADLKIGNIITRFWSAGHDKKLRRALTASWAGKVLARYPEAREVVVHLERFDPVSSEAYRRGERAEWKLFYRGKFRANGRSA